MIRTPLNLAMLGDPQAQQFCETLGLADIFAPLTDPGCASAVTPLFSRDFSAPSLGANATFTRASTAYVKDHLGVHNAALSGEARFEGARRVLNGVRALREAASAPNSSDNLTGCTSSTITIAFADGETTLTMTGANSFVRWTKTTLNLSNSVRLFAAGSCQIKGVGASIGKKISLNFTSTGLTPTHVACTLTSEYQRFVFYTTDRIQDAINVNVYMGLDFDGGTLSVNDQVKVKNCQIELLSAASEVGEYVSAGVISAPYHGANVDGVKYFSYANGNTVASNVVTEAQGAAIDPATIRLLMEPVATNLCLQSQTAGTTWTQTNVTIAADAVAAPDGTATADTLTATADNATWVQTTTAASAEKTWSIWIKRKTGTGTISMSLDGGSTYTDKTITAGWSRYSITQTLANPSMVLKIGTNTDAVWVWGSQLELGAVATSYIPTTTAAMVRAVDALAYSGISADNETRQVINAANVDIDDWNGTKATPTVPELISSITVYKPGERPA